MTDILIIPVITKLLLLNYGEVVGFCPLANFVIHSWWFSIKYINFSDRYWVYKYTYNLYTLENSL